MGIPLVEATNQDSAAIADLLIQSWNEPHLRPFTQLQYGTLNSDSLGIAMTTRISKLMQSPNINFMTIREPHTNDIIAVAQWTLPTDNKVEVAEETQEDKKERQEFEDEIRRKELPSGSNKDFIMKFAALLRDLCEGLVAGKKYFTLENIVTRPHYRGRGFATQLIQWAFEQADVQNALIYLETASDNPAKRLYENLGFEEKGTFTIPDLSVYGGSRRHTHLAFIRYPKHAS